MVCPKKAILSVIGILVLISSGFAQDQNLIAKIGQVPVSEFDVAVEMQRKIPPQVSFHGKIAPEKMAEFRQQVQESLIDQAYQVNWAIDQKVSVSEEDLLQALQPYVKRFGSLEEFRRTLGEKKFNDLRALLYREQLAQRARDLAIGHEVAVPEQKMREFYEKNKQKFFQPKQYRASHILVKVDPSSNQHERNELLQEAQRLLEKAQSGKDFYNLAYYNSDDRTRYVGGDLGYFSKKDVVSEFGEALAALEPGEISGLVRTRFGYHIIKLTDVRAARQLSLEEIRGKMVAQMEKEQRELLYTRWMEKLRSEYPITRFANAESRGDQAPAKDE